MRFIKKYPLLLAAFISLSLHGLMAAYLFPSFSKTSSHIALPVEVVWKQVVIHAQAGTHGKNKSLLTVACSTNLGVSTMDPRLREDGNKVLKKSSKASDSLKPRNDEHKKQSPVQPALRDPRTQSGSNPENSMRPIAKVNKNYPSHTLPPYPWVCRKRGQEGVVSLCLRTNQSGQVIGVTIAKSSGYDLLDQAALNAVKSWIFAELNTQKTLSIAFRLKDEELSIS
jgi:TonB family protein